MIRGGNVNMAAAFLSIGRTKTYDMLAPRGPIKAIRVGRAVRVPMSAVRDWTTEQLESAHDHVGDDRDHQ
jgi:excisionase family DNA binding protein